MAVKKPRKHNFPLPYHMAGLYCSVAISQLEADCMVSAFPVKLIKRIYDGSGMFGDGVDITQEDIDSLSDTAYNYLIKKMEEHT